MAAVSEARGQHRAVWRHECDANLMMPLCNGKCGAALLEARTASLATHLQLPPAIQMALRVKPQAHPLAAIAPATRASDEHHRRNGEIPGTTVAKEMSKRQLCPDIDAGRTRAIDPKGAVRFTQAAELRTHAMKRRPGFKTQGDNPGAIHQRLSVACCHAERCLAAPWPDAPGPDHVRLPFVEECHVTVGSPVKIA